MAADAGAKSQLKRTRTGCFKCRVRRRKCDERKPSCQRCLDGGFDCQYGTKLSFLDKNALTAPHAHTGKPNRKSYSALRFVHSDSTNASPPSPSDGFQDASQAEGSVSETTSSSRSTADGPQTDTLEPLPTPSLSEFGPVNSHVSQPIGHQHLNPQPSTGFHVDTSPSNAAYETALNVLLSLGTENTPAASAIDRGDSSLPEFVSPFEVDTSSVPTSIETPGAPFLEQFPNCSVLPQDRIIQLLRHYRYVVAPWLDIGDPEQTFGLQVIRFAMSSPSILEALLALSLTSLHRTSDNGLKGATYPSGLIHPAMSGMGLLDSIIVITFSSLRNFASVTPMAWQSPFASAGLQTLDSALGSDGLPSIRLAVSWALLRLDVAVGFTSSSAVSIPSILPYGAGSPAATEIPRGFIDHAREPLYICARVLNHCFGHDLPVSLGTAQNWKILLDELNLWYNNRHKDFMPVFEYDEADQLFPLVIFTCGSATLANQLYHTAMLLLLQNRPRTLQNERSRGVMMSPLWHSQRICGISLNNDSRAAWDFSLVGSLYVAAKRMTYEPQQQAILAGIGNISKLTGWDLSSVSGQLMQDWQPD